MLFCVDFCRKRVIIITVKEINQKLNERTKQTVLLFKYGAMSAGKSQVLIENYNLLKDMGEHVLVWNSDLDDRRKGYVTSRNAKLEDVQASLYKNTTNLFNKFFIELAKRGWVIELTKSGREIHDQNVDKPRTVLLVDEAQFLTAQQVDQLSILAEYESVVVKCYGLRTDFEGNLFEGSKRLFEVADDSFSIETECRRCKERPAIFNARFYRGKLCNGESSQIMIDNDEAIKYVPLCRTCFNVIKENDQHENDN